MGRDEGPGPWLKRTRIAAGYPKQETLAKAIGLGRGAIGNWETGGRPDIGNVPPLATALGVSQQEIIERFGIRSNGDTSVPVPPWAREILTRLDSHTTAINDLVEYLKRSRAEEVAILRGIDRGIKANRPGAASSPRRRAPQVSADAPR